MNKSVKMPIVLIGLLIIQIVALTTYTAYVVSKEGFIFVQVALENAKSLAWNGQFTLDFGCYLSLSALWIIWRNEYKLSAIVIAIVAAILGIVVFAPYVLYLVYREKGNLIAVLIGDRKTE